VVGTAVLAGLVLAACGSSGSGGGDETAAEKTTNVTIAATGDPTSGGKVTMGVEGESDGWLPAVDRWAVSGLTVGQAIFDPLAAYDANGVAQPYLAESFTPNADFTSWTVTVRPNIQFHNGQPLDGAAVKKSLEAAIANPLIGSVLTIIDTITVDPSNPLAVIVTMKSPWASFPASLTLQPGYIAAPAQIDAPAPDNSRIPIGTGPFVFSQWTPDKSFVATKNPNYWRTDSAGNKLPYLDEVEFVPVTDAQNRVTALITGDVQLMHTTNWPSIATLKAEADAGKIQFVAEPGESEESFIIFNTDKAPLDDVRVRKAAALCTDQASYLTANEIPAEYAADSQFKKDSPWYNPDAGFPTYDPAAGTALIAEVEAEKGPVEFSLGTTSSPENLLSTQVIKSQWEVCGMTVNLQSSIQSKFVLDMVLGNYDANLSRQFAAPDPDADYQWWTSANAAPAGSLALNMARLRDDQVDAALKAARESADTAVREQAYDTLQVRHSQLVPYVWLNHSQFAYGAQNNVRNIGNQTLPGGAAAQPFVKGDFRLTEMWLQQ
jgi:peptide/nickel transport system substrate-binding protein